MMRHSLSQLEDCSWYYEIVIGIWYCELPYAGDLQANMV